MLSHAGGGSLCAVAVVMVPLSLGTIPIFIVEGKFILG